MTTTLRALGAVSRVPHVPISGLATVQSVVSLGQALDAGAPAALNAARSMLAVASTTSWPGAPSMSATEGPVRNCRSLTAAGKPGRNWPDDTSQAAVKSWPPW